MEFTREFMQALVWGDYDEDGRELKMISDDIVDTDRWSTIHEIIFTVDGKFYSSSYSRGSTEMQDESPYEYDGAVIKCMEVMPIEKTVTVYVRKE